MIDGGTTCGYRPYAEKYGHIIYLAPQDVKEDWEHSMTAKQAREFIGDRPDAVVWAIKHDPARDKKVLRHLSNQTLYYSCNSKNLYNKHAKISLVDTKERAKGGKNTRIHIKGKDPDFWKPVNDWKEFDYVMMGRRADKNEMLVIDHLNRDISETRRILWIGGKEHEKKIRSKRHEVVCTEFEGAEFVRDHISKARVGILFTAHAAEGFPQSLLEMKMCGVPVIYSTSGPYNPHYFPAGTGYVASKGDLVEKCEIQLRDTFLSEVASEKVCRENAIKSFSLEASYRNLIK
jgi:glycosyltransferase involved in cell wall biosynthesis